MKRVWMISDTHLGCRSNSVMWLNLIEDYFFNFFIPLVKKEYKKGDVLFHLGDVFDNRQSLNLAAQNLGIRVFEELGKIFPEVHIIVGNHDIMRKNSNDISSVDCLKYIPNVNVHKEPKIISRNSNANCVLMPWRRNSDHEKETLAKIAKKLKGDKKSFLFCHSETQGVQTSPSKRHLHDGGNSVEVFKGYHRVYSGHIHYRQEKKNFTLVGNPYHMTRSDRDNTKGIYVLDLETGDHTFFENEYSPKFTRYYMNDLFERRMAEIKSEIENNFVDIFVPSNALGKYNINQFMTYLDGHARKLEPRIYDEENPIECQDDNISDFKGELDIFKIAQDYVNGLDYDEELKQKLVNSIKELYLETTTPTYAH